MNTKIKQINPFRLQEKQGTKHENDLVLIVLITFDILDD